jgi:hypothetical protein
MGWCARRSRLQPLQRGRPATTNSIRPGKAGGRRGGELQGGGTPQRRYLGDGYRAAGAQEAQRYGGRVAHGWRAVGLRLEKKERKSTWV